MEPADAFSDCSVLSLAGPAGARLVLVLFAVAENGPHIWASVDSRCKRSQHCLSLPISPESLFGRRCDEPRAWCISRVGRKSCPIRDILRPPASMRCFPLAGGRSWKAALAIVGSSYVGLQLPFFRTSAKTAQREAGPGFVPTSRADRICGRIAVAVDACTACARI